MTRTQAIARLQECGLRVTGPRISVLVVLGSAEGPVSHTDVLSILPETECNPATVYRNLVKLRESGIAVVASRADGIDRYSMSDRSGQTDNYPHFICDDCGQVARLPFEVTSSITSEGRWAASVENAVIQFRGECPDCI